MPDQADVKSAHIFPDCHHNRLLLQMRKYLIIFLLPILFAGCAKQKQAAADDKIIKQYISDHHLNAVAEPNGLYYVEALMGTGNNPTIKDSIIVKYTGYLTDGTIFDQNLTGTKALSLRNVIVGWQQGIPLMKKGGKATLLIPSALGYADQYVSASIPPNAVLLFDVELIDFH